MPDFDYDEFDDNGSEQSGGPRALREQLAKLKKELEGRDAKIAALESEKSELAGKVKSNTIRDALGDAGIDPKYARFAERDGVEPDEASVKQWVEDNRDVYAFLAKASAGTAGEGEGEEQLVEDEVDPDLQAALESAQGLESSGRPSGSNSIIAQINAVNPDQFTSEAEIDKFIASIAQGSQG